MKYLTKILLLLVSISLLFSQDSDDPYRVGVDYKSKVKLVTNDEATVSIIQNIIESAFSSTVNKTVQNNWKIEFDKIAASKIDAVLAEQKDQEDFSECIDTKCAIKIGELLQAKYMIYRDITSVPGRSNSTQISFKLINIENGTSDGAADTIFKGDLFSPEAKKAFNNTMVELFNDAFPNQIPIPISKKIDFQNLNAPTVDNINMTVTHSRPRTTTLYGSDKDGDNLSFTIYKEPRNGSYQLTGSKLLYNPEKGFVGTDTMRYRATDGERDSNIGVINIRVVNNEPLSQDQSITIDKNKKVRIILSATDEDKDKLEYKITRQPIKGGRLKLRALGEYDYTPPKDFDGTDYFEFKAYDGITSSESASVSIQIKADKSSRKSVIVSGDNNDNGGPNMLMIVGGLLLLVLLGAAGGGGDSGPAPTGGVDIGIDIP